MEKLFGSAIHYLSDDSDMDAHPDEDVLEHRRLDKLKENIANRFDRERLVRLERCKTESIMNLNLFQIPLQFILIMTLVFF